MFGLLVSGRLPNVNFNFTDQTHCVADVADVDQVNYLVVFLTGQTPFPDGAGGAVYLSWPSLNGGPSEWQYLGYLSNQKPSAIFKVARNKSQEAAEQTMISKFSQQMQQSQIVSTTAQVGISIEPMSLLQGLQQNTVDSEAIVPKFVEFTQKMVQSLFNFTASYAMEANEARLKPSETFVPYSAIHQWCMNFERRIKLDPYFWSK